MKTRGGATRRRIVAAAGAVSLVAAVSAPASSQTAASTSPDDWDVKVASLPVVVKVAIPPVLPLEVTAGAGYAGIGATTQPLILASVGPVYAPVLDALGLLGGTGALVPIVSKLVPALALGAPTIFGLPPTPIDPGLVPALPLPPIPSPELPVVQCTANFPGDPRAITCGGPQQAFFGYEFKALSGTATTAGEASDVSTLKATSAVRGAGFGPSPGSTFFPLEIGTLDATSDVRTAGDAVVGRTAVAVGGIDILDGLLQIDAVRNSLTGSLTGRPGKADLARDVCDISGLRLAGVPLSVGPAGITVGKTESPSPLGGLLGGLVGQLTSLANQTVTMLSLPLDVGKLSLRALPVSAPSIREDGTRIETSTSCLEVNYSIPASGSSVTVIIGQSTLSMSAYRLGLSDDVPDREGSVAAAGSSGGAQADGLGLGVEPMSEELAGPGESDTFGAGAGDLVPVTAGSGAPAPSRTRVFRQTAVKTPDWSPVLLAVALVGVAALALTRSRRVVWERTS